MRFSLGPQQITHDNKQMQRSTEPARLNPHWVNINKREKSCFKKLRKYIIAKLYSFHPDESEDESLVRPFRRVTPFLDHFSPLYV